jgi:hypothetical protein
MGAGTRYTNQSPSALAGITIALSGLPADPNAARATSSARAARAYQSESASRGESAVAL